MEEAPDAARVKTRGVLEATFCVASLRLMVFGLGAFPGDVQSKRGVDFRGSSVIRRS